MPLVYQDLSYKVIGAVYNVYNTIGFGYREKEYQKAIALEFDKLGVKYERELYALLRYNDEPITKFFLDFLVEGKIVLEIKVANEIYKKHFKQVLQYLKNKDLRLGIIAVVSSNGVLIQRVVN